MKGTKQIRWPTKYRTKPKEGHADLWLTHNKQCKKKSLNVVFTKQTFQMDEMDGKEGDRFQGLAVFVFFEIWRRFFFLFSKCHLPFFINSLSAVMWVWWRKTFRWRTEVESSEGRCGWAWKWRRCHRSNRNKNLILSNTEATWSN